MDVQSQAACDTLCGTAIGIFSEKHTCKKGGSGTTNQCRLKTGIELDEACLEEGDCSEAAALTASPVTAAAIDLANRADGGRTMQEAEAGFGGEAVESGGLFGYVLGPGTFEFDVPTEFTADLDLTLSASFYRLKAARRGESAELPEETSEEIYIDFDSAMVAEMFEKVLRDLLPASAQDRTNELQIDGLAFAFGSIGSSNGIPDPEAETVTLVARAGNHLILSETTSTTGGAIQSYSDRDFQGLISALNGPAPNLDL